MNSVIIYYMYFSLTAQVLVVYFSDWASVELQIHNITKEMLTADYNCIVRKVDFVSIFQLSNLSTMNLHSAELGSTEYKNVISSTYQANSILKLYNNSDACEISSPCAATFVYHIEAPTGEYTNILEYMYVTKIFL